MSSAPASSAHPSYDGIFSALEQLSAALSPCTDWEQQEKVYQRDDLASVAHSAYSMALKLDDEENASAVKEATKAWLTPPVKDTVFEVAALCDGNDGKVVRLTSRYLRLKHRCQERTKCDLKMEGVGRDKIREEATTRGIKVREGSFTCKQS